MGDLLPLFSSSYVFSTLVLLSQHFLLVLSKQSPMYHNCDNGGGNYTVNSTFSDNLNKLISSLSSLPLNDDGFYNVSVGKNTDKVNSVSLCRGDVNPVECLACVAEAGEEIKRRCPNQKEAIIWYDNCTMRYSNRALLSVMERYPAFYIVNPNSFTGDLEGIKTALSDLLKGLRDKAAGGGVRKKFAVGRVFAPSFQTLYGMVQCTPDMSEQECSSCLTQSFGQIPVCCDQRIGARFYTPSCFFRFETSPFFYTTTVEELSPPPPVSPPPSPPPVMNETRSGGEGKKNGDEDKAVIFIVVPIAVTVMLMAAVVIFLKLRKKKPNQNSEKGKVVDKVISADSLLFDFKLIRDATDNFSSENKLGEGGFGTVHKGVLPDGRKIAVKRLRRNAGQGETEFKNEVLLLAKLQHRNLVRLLGLSIRGTERLLIYEFVLNSSLDNFLFDPIKRSYLDWLRRFGIIGGIARGLVYLHEDSRLRIIHRDLKASNILLDEEMNPKIADFGTARLFDIDQTTQRFTNRIVGTLGYMAPEYAIHGQFSFKTDVYSFGVLVLEIVSGQRNNCFRDGEDVGDLVTFAWKYWEEGRPLDLVDTSLIYGSRKEMLRCINIGLLCVQEDVGNRPNMASVVLMLSSRSLTIPVPSRPAFSMRHISRTTNSSQLDSFVLDLSANHDSVTDLYPR